jgi:hypothetical protein
VEFTYIEPEDGEVPAPASPLAEPRTPSPVPMPATGDVGITPRGTPAPVVHVSPPSNDYSRHDAPSGQELRYHKMEELIGDTQPPGQVAHVLDISELHAISSEEPSTFAKAE